MEGEVSLGHVQRRASLVDLRREKKNTLMEIAINEERGNSRRLTRLRHELVLQREKMTTPDVVRADADRHRRRGSATRGGISFGGKLPTPLKNSASP